MCGISGIVAARGEPVRPSAIAEMTAKLRHRGPDDTGHWVDGHVALGHTRLSIIDLSDTGHQPMRSADGSVTLVFNGEIYNFRELRTELTQRGHAFNGRSDTEVLLAAYLEWGVDAFRRLNGMFAAGFWDATRSRLVLLRDRFGIKPLYYRRAGARLQFASEIKALLAFEAARTVDTDLQGLGEYACFGNALGRTTLYAGVHRLLPGCWAEFDGESLREHRYWLAGEQVCDGADFEDSASRVRGQLIASVGRQLVSDVPIGAFLSGGVDSTAVVAAAASLGTRLNTYTARFDFDPCNPDVEAARRVAKHFGTEHHELDVGAGDLRDVIVALVGAHDGPFGDAANVPLYLLARELRGFPKVILQGDGGDELFGGYRRYSLLARIGILGPVARLLAPAVRSLRGGNTIARLQRMVRALGERDAAARMALLLCEDKPDAGSLDALGRDFRAVLRDRDPFLRYREVAAALDGRDPLQMMLLTDCSILLPDIFLEKVDRPTMAHGIEVRVPLLDHDLGDFVLGLPARIKLRAGDSKSLFKRAVAGLVPDFVINRPKAGFGVPYGQWLRGPLRSLAQDVLLVPHVATTGLFDVARVEQLLAEHVSGVRDHAFVLWKLLNLGLWWAGRES